MARIRKSEATGNAAKEKVIWSIALYIRLSKDDGNDESLSVTNQRKILTEYVEREFQGDYVIVSEYVDDGKTGTDYDRPSFQRMIADVETKRVNCVICKNLARAFRNYSDQGYFIESFFPLHGTRFITLSDPKVDTYLNPEAVSGMEMPISGLMNDRFAAQTSNSIRRTFDNKRRNGEFIGAFAPYGYAKDPGDKNVLIVDDEAARVVKNVFKWYVMEGLSKEGIVRKLNARGIPNPTAYKRRNGLKYCNPQAHKNDGLWMSRTVTMILKNKMYIGTMVQGRQKVISYKVHDKIATPEDAWYEVPNTHEPIIAHAVFDRAQQLQQRDTRTAPGKKENYLFSGFLKCADCKKSMTRSTAKGSYIYYMCSTYKRKSKDQCTKHTMRFDVLEKAVWMAIRKQIELVENLEDMIDKINHAPIVESKSVGLAQILKLHQNELTKAQNIIKSLYVDWKNQDITREQYHSMKRDFEDRATQLATAITHLEEEYAVTGKGTACADPRLQYFLKHRNIEGLTQGVLTELVEAIYIHEGGKITIQFKFGDPYRRIADDT